MKARQRLDSGISSSSSSSEKQDEIKCSERFGNKNLDKGPIITENVESIECANVHDDIKAGQFEAEAEVDKQGKQGVPIGGTAINNYTETYRRNLAENAQETEVKQIEECDDDTQYILQKETSPKKGDVSGGEIKNNDRSKSKFMNKTVETGSEVKVDCGHINRNCNWERRRNSVCSEHVYSTHEYESTGERLTSFRSVPCKLCTVPNTVSKGYIDVTRRCDDLLNELQQLALKNIAFRKTYTRIRKSFYILALLNIILITCMIINFPILLTTSGKWQSNSAVHDNAVTKDHNPGTICFNCSELNDDSGFSLETLTDVRQKNGICCYQSIISELRSIKWNVQTTLDYSLQYIKKSLVQTDKRLLALEVGSFSDSSQIIGRILQVVSPQEKTVVYLRSRKDTPVVMDPTVNGNYNKIGWNRDDTYSLLTDSVSLSRDGVNIKVKFEGYYFINTRVQISKRKRMSYQNVPLSYHLYRQRGSTATYVHEAKINCIFNDKTQEHSSTSELVLQLNRDDEIFLEVDDEYTDFLSREPCAHTLVMFEL